MKMLTKLRKINMSTDIEKFVKVVATVAMFVLIGIGFDAWSAGVHKKDMQRKEAICPALLSIGRSSRDTLIVMKAEPLCNSFVLENLK